LKIHVYFIGKPRDTHANAIAAEFVKRTTRYCDCTQREVVPSRFDLFAKHGSARKIFLDPGGRSMNSDQFAQLFQQAEFVGQDLVFLIGAHDGLPPEWKGRADLLLSLSDMTLPHELARAVLLEQIYRAWTILRGHPYPR
jgi:23S rRNA (pseudouridine1915-N3)-methyltransferase